jgi:GT2 family glycosyltransferase
VIRLRRDPNPRASVLIVAFNRRDRIERCLQSLEARVSRSIAFETVVVLNGAHREVREFMERSVKGVTLASSEVNAGFAGACNLGRRHANGSFLVLLNDDAEIEEGWLEQLVETADAHPEAGAIGSAVLFPDGRLQEAGSILWCDGSTMPVGRGAPGLTPEYDFVRDVDYCSACSLLVRARTWDVVGGMDEEYFPAYYEDCDLCMKIRRRGQRVLYAPRSRVRHHEGSSTDSHFRDFLMRRNRVRFQERWRLELADREPPAPCSPKAVERAIRRARPCLRRLLIIDDRPPDPVLGSGFARMLEVVRAVADDHDVSFWCSAGPAAPSDILRDHGARVVHGAIEDHLSTPDMLYDAVLISRPHNFARYGELVRQHQRHAAIVYDAEALYHRRLERRLTLERDERAAAALAVESRRMRDVEERIRSSVQAIVTVTALEAAFFAACRGSCRVTTIWPELPWTKVTRRPFDDRTDVVFVAAWLAGSDSPNADGLRWFLNAIWPTVVAAVPWARLKITGDAPVEIREALSDASVEFCGLLPDLYHVYDAARVAILPLRYGAGLSIKGLEALKFGVPVVATSLGGADLDAIAPGAAWTADTAPAFAAGLIALLTVRDEWNTRRRAILEAAPTWPVSSRREWRALLDDAQISV